MPNVQEFDVNALKVKTFISKYNGVLPTKINHADGFTSESLRASLLKDMPAAMNQLKALRTGGQGRIPVDLSLGVYIKEKFGFSPSANGTPDSFFHAIGINPSTATIAELMSMPDFDTEHRFLVPELFREAIQLGLIKNPLYKYWIKSEEFVSQQSVTLPYLNPADAMPTKLAEGDTIPTGSLSFGKKTVNVTKIGTGIKMTYEVKQFVPLNLVATYLQEAGNKLNIALDSMAVDVLINGNKSDGTEAAPVIGVQTANSFSYLDFLRASARMNSLGRVPKSLLSDETTYLEVQQLQEFKGRVGDIKDMTLNLRVPIPNVFAYDIHASMPAGNLIMLIDPSSALIKLNASGLIVESERIVEKQIEGTYVTLMTSFASLFRDGRLIIDKTKTYAANPFPSWMDIITFQKQTLK